ncbi:hypothetical protein BJY01DRAFT_245913 [Aspergillus pseudoustus]|uniref:Extracellular membrane protein CFEM domain-containing protein n=1 Tax=Aspergillus pseudoustus TaxID=1810923 RepID=A0ABR4KB15_9EURO
MRSLTLTGTLLPLSLLATTVHAQNFTHFRDYISSYLPGCIVGCTVSATERDTNCGSGSVSSTDARDIDCLCDAFWTTDQRLLREFSVSMARCVTDSRCTPAELNFIALVDPYTLFDGVDSLCGDRHDHDHDDSNSSNHEYTSNNSTNSSNSNDTQSPSDTANDTNDSSAESSSNGDDESGAASISSRSITALAAGVLVALAAF